MNDSDDYPKLHLNFSDYDCAGVCDRTFGFFRIGSRD